MDEEVNSSVADEEGDLSYLFTCDTNPSHITDELDIPSYSSKFQVLKQKEEKAEEEKKPRRSSGVTCWNCGGSHNLRDCTEPRNHAVIAQKRAESQAKFTKAVRYHADDEQKYPHLHPGKISDRLREAMGLRADQAPPFIYRMRELGYPPGWVEEAKVSHSGLSMFDSSGQEVKDPDLEDGEIMSYVDRDKYDLRKLIEYPGFNVPFEEGTADETESLRACPMRESQSIKHMQHLWSGKKTGSYRRKRLKMQSSSGDSPSVLNRSIPPEAEDMELDAEQEEVKFLPPTDACVFIPPLPVSSPGNQPPPPTPPSPANVGNPVQSPTGAVKRKLSVMEDDLPPGTEEETKQKQSEKEAKQEQPKEESEQEQLEGSKQEQLEEASKQEQSEEASEQEQTEEESKQKHSEEESKQEKSAEKSEQKQAEEEGNPTAATESTDSTAKKNADFASPAETYNGRVKSVSSGTPVITRSEFKYLPSPENFSKNICDVINFENLPNATGKYDQMHGLIKKVRTYVTESLLKADEDGDDDE